MTWLLLGAAIVVEVTATLSLRASEGFTRWVWAIRSRSVTAPRLLLLIAAGVYLLETGSLGRSSD